MPNKPNRRQVKSTAADRELTAGALAKLYRIEPYHRNEVTAAEIRKLQDLIDLVGFPTASKEIGLDKQTLLTVCAGFGHKLQPWTADVIRNYLRGSHE